MSANYEAFHYEVLGVSLVREEQKLSILENHTRQMNTLCGKHARYFNVKTSGTNKSRSDLVITAVRNKFTFPGNS